METIIGIILVLAYIYALWKMIFDAMQHGDTGWALLIFFIPLWGLLSYYFIKYKYRK
jgi:hypothetical protein